VGGAASSCPDLLPITPTSSEVVGFGATRHEATFTHDATRVTIAVATLFPTQSVAGCEEIEQVHAR
jgi:hypothetical protein